MIKLIIFDVDGVLVETKDIHYKSLNSAIKKFNTKAVINRSDHSKYYDGLSTSEKLQKLFQLKKIKKNQIKPISEDKKKITKKLISNKNFYSKDIEKIFKILSKDYKLAIASNAIDATVQLIIDKLKIKKYLSFSLSNEDVTNVKPHSEIYLKCMIKAGVNPKETLILEDSYFGRVSSTNSGAYLLPIENIKDVNLNRINTYLKNKNNQNERVSEIWKSDKLNILIPMAGLGKRFQEKGFTFPKPLIEINGKPMIKLVKDSLKLDGSYIFIIQKEHYEKYNLKYFFDFMQPNSKIVLIDKLTEGAACTTLLAKKYINNNNNLIIANSDQIIKWNANSMMYEITSSKVDGGILTFESTHPKWSYAKLNSRGFVSEVAEKKVISNLATVGVYYWKKGSDYVKYAEQMIKKNIRTNNEFYVCPVFNEAIKDSKKIKTYNVDSMMGVGTPEDLDYYLKYNRN